MTIKTSSLLNLDLKTSSWPTRQASGQRDKPLCLLHRAAHGKQGAGLSQNRWLVECDSTTVADLEEEEPHTTRKSLYHIKLTRRFETHTHSTLKPLVRIPVATQTCNPTVPTNPWSVTTSASCLQLPCRGRRRSVARSRRGLRNREGHHGETCFGWPYKRNPY